MCNALVMTPFLKLSILYNLQTRSGAVYGLRLTAHGLRLTALVRPTAHGLRLTAYGLRLTAYGLRLTALPDF